MLFSYWVVIASHYRRKIVYTQIESKLIHLTSQRQLFLYNALIINGSHRKEWFVPSLVIFWH